MAIVTTATARAYVGAAASEDAQLQPVLDGVLAWLGTKWIPAYLGSPDSLAEVLDGPRPVNVGISLDTAEQAIDAAHRITLAEQIAFGDLEAIEFRDSLDGDWYDHDPDAPDDFSDFEVDRYDLIRRSQPWPANSRSIRVTYQAGYADDEGPADWRLVALESMRALWRTRASQGLRAAAIGPMSVSFESLVQAGVSPQMLYSIRRAGGY